MELKSLFAVNKGYRLIVTITTLRRWIGITLGTTDILILTLESARIYAMD